MKSIRTSLLERFAEVIGLNRIFHEVREDFVEEDPRYVVSPVEATLAYSGKIVNGGKIIGKWKREISLEDVLGVSAKLFDGGFYYNFYLSPKNRHYWRVPYDGKFVYTKRRDGKAMFPVFIGLENFFHSSKIFERAVKENATVGSVLQTENFPLAMVAVGSLGVNGIHTSYEEGKNSWKGDVCGHFSVGSTMIICFPKDSVKKLLYSEHEVKIGEPIAEILKN